MLKRKRNKNEKSENWATERKLGQKKIWKNLHYGLSKMLMRIKNCHSCSKRSGCTNKNSKENLLKEAKKIECIDRSTFRVASRERNLCYKDGTLVEDEVITKPKPQTFTRLSLCKDYSAEGN